MWVTQPPPRKWRCNGPEKCRTLFDRERSCLIIKGCRLATAGMAISRRSCRRMAACRGLADKPRNIAASVRQRLLNLARAEGQAFDVVLVAFGLERFIYRLSVSAYRDCFVLKGGILATLWTKDRGRFARAIDFLSFVAADEGTLTTRSTTVLCSTSPRHRCVPIPRRPRSKA